MSEFLEGVGYDDEANNKDGRAYNAPVAYAGLSLRQLRTSNRSRYETVLQLREAVRAATEKSLGLRPGTLFVDFTTVSQKTAGGAHRAHADNCIHYFDEENDGMATCDGAREHPYPKRVDASILYLNDQTGGNFAEGEFYFANRKGGGVDEVVPIEAGKMIYFTSGIENLHGALPVKQRPESKDGEEPSRRLALAMWYVTDPSLEEYVPSFQEAKEQSSPELKSNALKPGQVHDPNDPTAPTELFVVPIPKSIDINALFESMGKHLITISKQRGKRWQTIDGGDYTLHMLFDDHSAMFTLDFGVALEEASSEHADSSVVVERNTEPGKRASLQYMLQESVILHGVLDALGKLIMEESDEDEKRYLEGEMEKARSTLPARGA